MARKPRVEYENAFYHVIYRGNNQQKIYLDREDYRIFLKILKETKGKYFLRIHGYVLMKNHVHQLIETPKGNLSAAMQSLLTRYVRYFNKRHKKTGHLFQGRYKAILCQKENYLLELVRYIHLNPVRANAVKRPEDWEWSGYRAYLGLIKDVIVDTEDILSYFGDTLLIARRRFAEFISEGIDMEHREEYYKVSGNLILGDERFVEEVKMKISNPVRTSKRITLKNISFSELAGQISGELKIKDIKERTKQRKINFARQVFSYISRKYYHRAVKDIAEYLSQELSAVSQGLRRFEIVLAKDESKRKYIDYLLGKLKSEM